MLRPASIAAIAVATSAIFFCRESRADVFAFCASCTRPKSHHQSTRDGDRGFLSAEFFTMLWRTPAVGVNQDVPGRLIGMPVGGDDAKLFGANVAFTFRENHFFWELFKVSYAMGLDGPASSATANGQPYTVARGPLHLVQFAFPFLMIPGVQIYEPDPSFKVNLNVDWGIGHMFADVKMTNAAGAENSGTMNSWAGFLRANLGLCLHTGSIDADTRSWTCLTASPNIIGWSGGDHAFDGVSFGVRGEL